MSAVEGCGDRATHEAKMAEFAVQCLVELASGVREASAEIARRLPTVDPSQRVYADGFAAGVLCAVEALDDAAAFARAAVSS